jgi:two-component system LytT family response regulator
MTRSNARALRVLIADDEPLARQRLADLLEQHEGVELVDVAENGDEAVKLIRSLEPDLVFLDVQMPGKSGLDVVRAVGADTMPATIFVTAYDQHALKAFELAAVDYLVKPFDDERFASALQRARRLVELKQVGKLSSQLLSLLQGSAISEAGSPRSPAASAPKAEYLERIAVESRGQVRVVPVKQIDFILASGPYAELHVGDKRHLIRERMQNLEDRLDPKKFIRVHRSAIVRADLIETLFRAEGGDYTLQLKGGVKLKVSRSRVEELQSRLGL